MSDAAVATAEEVVPPKPFRAAGFWRRVGAFLVDGALLGIVGVTLAVFLTFAFPFLGPWGRLVGLTMGTAYFGIMNSRIGAGQTVGKRLLKLVVVDRDGELLDVRRSVARAGILNLILLTNGWAIPFASLFSIITIVQSLILFVGLAVSLYGLFFNRTTRQLPHDILTQSFVIKHADAGQMEQPVTPRVHHLIGGIIAGVVTITIVFCSFLQAPYLLSVFGVAQDTSRSIFSLYNRLNRDERFFTAQVNANTTYRVAGNLGTGQPLRTLNITVWYKGFCSGDSNCFAVVDDIARMTFEQFKPIQDFDGMIITVLQKTDLGYGEYHMSNGAAYSIADWKKRLKIR